MGTRDSDLPPREHLRDEASRRLQGVIPDLIKKAVIGGVDRASEARERLGNLLGETKLPKEIADAIFGQIDETKSDLFRMVAKEIRGFLEAVDFQRELQKLLTTVSFEIKTEIRFIPNDSAPDKLGKPEVSAAMKIKRQSDEPEAASRPSRPADKERKRRRPLGRSRKPTPPVSQPPDDPLFGPDETPPPDDVE